MKSLAILFILLLFVSTNLAIERHVPGQYASVQRAINAAEDGDTVVIAPGLYRETIDFSGKAVTVRGRDSESWEAIQGTVINPLGLTGLGSHRCVVFARGEGRDSVLEGLTLTGGQAQVGGGVYCLNSSPTIRRCNIVRNSADWGGGISLVGACRALVIGCFITDNYANAAGGGILVRRDSSQLPMEPSRRATGPVPSALKMPLSDDLPERPDSMVVNCTITNNGAQGQYPYDVDCWDGRPQILNTIIYGSGLSLLIADASLVSHCCLREVHLFHGDYESSAKAFDIAGMAGNIRQAPDMVASGTGLYTHECHLRPTSPCIDAGDTTVALSERIDVDGQPRVMGRTIDIGADEVPPQLVVTCPSGGEIWVGGSTRTIRWDTCASPGDVDILFSSDAGDTWQRIASSIKDTGAFTWQLPYGVDSTRCVVLVTPSRSDPNALQTASAPFTIHPNSVGPVVGSKWPSLGGDFRRSGLSKDKGPEKGSIKWKFETDGAVVNSVTVGFDSRIHVACEDGRLYTLDADGVLLWMVDVNSPLRCTPSLGPDGSVHVGSEDGRVHVIDLDGRRRWTQRTGGPIYSSPAVAPNGDVYVGSADGSVYALARDGTERWRFQTRGPGLLPQGSIHASPVLGTDGTVYIAGLYDPHLYALDANDGSVKWSCWLQWSPEQLPNRKLAGWPFASPVVAKDGTVYLTLLYDDHLYAIEPNGGTVLWRTDLRSASHSSYETVPGAVQSYADGWSEPALGPDGTIYVSLDDAYLQAVDPNGHIKWTTPLGEVGGFTLSVDNGGSIYAASDDGYMYVITSEGAESGRFYAGGRPVFPVIAEDNLLIIADSQDYSMLNTGRRKSAVWAISAEDVGR